MSDTVHELEHAGLTIKIYYEEHADFANPRDNDGILGRLLVGGAGDDYGLGEGHHDEGSKGDLDLDGTCPKCDGNGYVYAPLDANADSDGDIDCPQCEGEGLVPRTLTEYFTQEYDARVVIPLFLLDHSGIALSWGSNMLGKDDRSSTRSTNRFVSDDAGWDTSFIGFAYDSKDSREHCGCEDWDAKKIEESIVCELTEFGAYIEGNVFYYSIESEEGDVLGGCGGFIVSDYSWGNDNYMIQEAKSEAESVREDLDKEAREAAYWLEREVPTVG